MIQGERFSALVSEVARAVVRRRSSDACCGDLTLEQFETLRAVDGSGRSSMGTLSAALGVDLSTMSRNVSVLERNRYLRRAKSAEDGRRVHVRLTARGRGALATLQCGESDVLGAVYQRIPRRARAAIVEALECLRGCLAESDRTVAACCSPPPVPSRRSAP